MSKPERVLDALMYGEELTAKQIAARFNVSNPRDTIYRLREQGYPVYLNKRTDSKGRQTQKYRLGRPSRSMIAAGMRALNEERQIVSYLRSA